MLVALGFGGGGGEIGLNWQLEESFKIERPRSRYRSVLAALAESKGVHVALVLFERSVPALDRAVLNLPDLIANQRDQPV